MSSICRRLGWEASPGESHLDCMLRGELLSALVSFGHEDTIIEAKRRFDAFLVDRDTSLLPADLRKVQKSLTSMCLNKDLCLFEDILYLNSLHVTAPALRRIFSSPSSSLLEDSNSTLVPLLHSCSQSGRPLRR